MNAIQKVVLTITATTIVAADAHAGRWLSRDPIQEGAGFVQRDPVGAFDFDQLQGEPNLYAFVINDPLNFADPWGLITIGFYGADTWFTFPNEGNKKMMQIGQEVGAAKMFRSLSHRAAFRFLLSQLDTNGDGKYDECDKEEPIKIFGHSWGAISAVKLAREIYFSPKFKRKDIQIVAVIDPVKILRLPPFGVPNNVKTFQNWYQTKGTGVRPFNFHGRLLPVAAGVNANQVDLNPDGSSTTTLYDGTPEIINHITIIWEVEPSLVQMLKN